MGVMHDKYGSAATHQCHEWVKLGFPEKGTFSFNQIEKIKTQLRAHEAKYKNNTNKWKPDWTALALWQKETLSRQVKQAKGEIKTNTAESPLGNSVFSPVTSVLQSGSSLYPNLQQLASIHKVNMDWIASLCSTGSGFHQRTTERTDSWPSSIDSIRERGKLFLCNW